MNIITKTIIGIAAAIVALSASSCSKDDTIRYNNATMGNIVNGKFVSDQGNTFNIIEQNCPGKLDTMKRAYIVCDVLNAVNGSEDEYDVRVNYIAPVLTKAPVTQSGITEEALNANDPIILQSLWISGGYVNIYLTIPVLEKNGKQHMINFVYDDTLEAKEGDYTFAIRHNAQGEILKEGNADNSKMVLAGAYASFPLSEIITEDAAKLNIKWNSYKIIDPGIIQYQTEELSVERLYTKDVDSQVPSNTATYSMLSDIE